ncbi:hypothetical protein GF358_01945 [Candidatus Woesearchaeota archaeon]|nr:hypothetical protein [Candidatus Woesearchaeota archaeon]
MDKKKIIKVFSFLIFLILGLYLAYAQIYLGTVEGYVLNITGGLVTNADIIVNVSGCTGTGCGGTTQTDSGGYYVVTNLNIESGDTIKVQANKTSDYGNNSGQADSYQAAYINVTIAKVPNSPTIIANPDTHDNSIIYFNWTSGTDPQGLSTYDVLTINSATYSNVTSPYNKTDVEFTTYNWNVKTCNTYGCSAAVSDSFDVYNTAPPSPTLQTQGDNINNTRTFNWSSGGADPENDSTYFEFKIDSDTIESSITPPINKTLSFGSHTWKVRECDPYECSLWTTDTFSITNNAPTTPTLTDQTDVYSPETVTLYWTSGTDPDGHSTYDEYKFNGTLSSNITSPKTEDLTGIIDYFVWEVRTCDVNGACSSWVNDTFIKYICPAPDWTK